MAAERVPVGSRGNVRLLPEIGDSLVAEEVVLSHGALALFRELILETRASRLGIQHLLNYLSDESFDLLDLAAEDGDQ